MLLKHYHSEPRHSEPRRYCLKRVSGGGASSAQMRGFPAQMWASFGTDVGDLAARQQISVALPLQLELRMDLRAARASSEP